MSRENHAHVLIVDDEEHSSLLIESVIRRHFSNIKKIIAAKTVKDAIHALEVNNIDLVFLDIELRGESGFTLLDKIKDRTFEFICLSASKDYAFKVFEYGGAGYLLKPVNVPELERAFSRIFLKRRHANDAL
ncbi:MAG TPA: response regulator [Bacteroidia bacterium]|nr:response regulator [Bacteroidia bacterium]